MPEAHKKAALTNRFREQIQAAQARLHDFQKDAEKAFDELAGRGREARKELDKLLDRIEKKGWVDRAELAGKAKDLGGEITAHLDELQAKAIQFVGVASRAQVEDLAHELKRLATKVEGLTRQGKRRSKIPQA